MSSSSYSCFLSLYCGFSDLVRPLIHRFRSVIRFKAACAPHSINTILYRNCVQTSRANAGDRVIYSCQIVSALIDNDCDDDNDNDNVADDDCDDYDNDNCDHDDDDDDCDRDDDDDDCDHDDDDYTMMMMMMMI